MIPDGLTSTAGIANMGTITFAGPIAPGAMDMQIIEFLVDANATAAEELIIKEEISAAMDDLGNSPTDIDSTPDADFTNDAGGMVDGPTDDTVDNENGDEDDADPENVFLEIFDLALRKTLAAGQVGPFFPGQDVTFDIEVFNQGSVEATNVVVTDYIPTGLVLNDGAWTPAGANATTSIASIPANSSTTVSITLTVTVDAPDGININTAEIASANDDNGDAPDDIDSTPDMDPSNDPEVNDEINDDGTNDEDDADSEEFEVQKLDLALRKTLAAGQAATVYPGEDVVFEIEVFNQSPVPAFNIEVTDYIPSGFTLNDGTWTAAAGNTATQTIAGPLAANSSTVITITLNVDPATAADIGTKVNRAEISSADNDNDPTNGTSPDIDSTPDNDPTNDTEVDDEINNAGGDEDDADLAEVDVQIFDLALRKTLAAGEDSRVYPGETVTFTVEVFNQGTVPASNIEVEDFGAAGLTAVGSPTQIIAGPIAPGASATVDFSFTVDADATAGTTNNIAEILTADDSDGNTPPDNDSTGDNDPNNDPNVDDEIDNNGGDEDDNDGEEVDIEIFDLSLTKDLAAGEDARVYPGETVTFTITLTNEGTVPAQNVTVVDYLPACLQLVDANWSIGASGFPETTVAGPIAPGGSTTVDITVAMTEACVGTDVVNVAEISDAEDDNGDNPTDADSTPDNDPNNDPDGEDDIDDEPIEPELFDLAFTKTLAAGEDDRVYPGDVVTFDLTVFNQGTVPAFNVEILDYTPPGFTPVGPVSFTIPGPIAPGASDAVQISFEVTSTNPGPITNGAEIQSAEDDLGDTPNDNDSNGDNDPDNDPTVDNEIDNNGGDEDDDDIETVTNEIFDLASNITLAPGEDDRVYPGETVEFKVTVFNQGTVAAENVEVTLMIPDGLTSTAGIPNMGTITFAGPIAPGAMDMQIIEFLVDPNATAAGELIVKEEISSFTDDLGGMPSDVDSTPDADFTNDVGGVVDGTTDDTVDNENGDEDDADPENVFLEIFDLASTVTLAPGEDDQVYPGETVEFKVTVFNQGSVAAENVEVTLMIPDGLTSTAGIPNMGTITIAGPIAPGAMDMQIIEFLVDPNATEAAELILKTEISDAMDDLGGTPTDVDSTPDADFTNDPGGMVDGPTDDTIDNENGDEDDADPENVFLQIFDLASNVTLAPGEDDRVYPGETVEFKVTVFNQGTVDAENIEVTLMIPAGLTSTAGIPNMGTITFAGPIAPGGMDMQILEFVVDANITTAGELILKEEISSFTDANGVMPNDVDSTPDADFTNDAGGVVDGPTDDTVDNENGDEDDADPENVFVEIFDLALRKTTDQVDRVKPGDDVTFTIEIFNQGSVPATNVAIVDYVPSQFTLSTNDTNGWTVNGANITNSIPGPIAAGASTTIDVVLQVQDGVMSGTAENFAEITAAQDDNGDSPADVDSDANNNNGDDALVDDEINNGGSDEDDHDVEAVEICDDVPPVLAGVPMNETIECSDPIPALPVIGVDITATDFSNDEFTITVEETSTQGEGDECSNHEYTITRVWTVVDECDNSSTATQVITVEDTTAPAFPTEAQDELVECDGNGNQGDLDAWLAANGNAIADDNCSDVVWTNDAGPLSDECGETGSVTVTFTATDVCGNSSQTTATFTIQDITAPDITTEAQDELVECGDTNDAELEAWLNNNGGAVASDLCSGTDVTWSFSPNPAVLSDDCGDTGSVEVTFTATDDCGNTSTTVATFGIQDTTIPEISCPGAGDLVLECGQYTEADVTAWLATASGTDTCDPNVTMSNDYAAGSLGDPCSGNQAPFELTVTFTATDECGNTNTCTANIIVEDTTDPEVACPGAGDLVLECGQYSEADVTAWLSSAAGTDLCDTDVEVTNDYVAGSLGDPCQGDQAPFELTVTFTATDNCGNTDQCTATIRVEDTTDPVIACPTDGVLILECGEFDEGDVSTWLNTVGATDICDADVELTNDYVAGTLGDPCIGNQEPFEMTVTFTATDNCGNTDVCTAIIRVEDNTAPEAVCPPAGDLVLECGQIDNAAITAWLNSAAGTDACDDDVEITNDYSAANLGEPCQGDQSPFEMIVTFTATDNCGNTDQCTATIRIEDNTPPEITCPPTGDLVLECGQFDESEITDWLATASGTDICDPSVDITNNYPGALGDPCQGTQDPFEQLVTFTATDDCGNTSTCTAVIRVIDNTPPVLAGVPADAEVECDNVPEADADVTATDECDNDVAIEMSETTTPGACQDSYVIERTWTATDNCGNSVSQTQIITVGDETPPTIAGVPDDVTVECDQIPSAPSQGSIVVEDNCDESPTLTFEEINQPSGVCEDNFTLIRRWTAVDNCGNITVEEQLIEVGDNTEPTITGVPDDVTVECDDVPPAPTVGMVTAEDNCDTEPTIEFEEIVTESGICEDNYTLTRRWTATDNCGNSAVAEQTIEVGDNTPPVLSGIPGNTVVECDDIPNSPAEGSITATDNCDNDVTITFEEDTTPSGVCEDAFTITRTWTATDNCGNTAVGVQTIEVGDNTPPTLAGIPADAVVECDDVPAAPADGVVSADDNCDNDVTITFEEDTTPSAVCEDAFTITRTWTATDNCGNTAVGVQTIEVGDNTPPTLAGIPADAVVECDDVPAAPADGVVSADDNCDNDVTITFEEDTTPSAVCDDAFTITRTWTATDNCGNTAVGVQTIEVGDNTPPTLAGIPADDVVECDDVPAAPADGVVSADDNCDNDVTITFEEDITPSVVCDDCLLYTSPSPRDATLSRMPSSA